MVYRRMRRSGCSPRLLDLPFVGPSFYCLNVNGRVIGMMAHGHIYEELAWLGPERMAAKRLVTEASRRDG